MIQLICILLVLFGVVNGNDLDFICLENGSIIELQKRCNGEIDCPNGSDESFVECKEYTNYQDEEDPNNPVFVCANGAFADRSKPCNHYTECSDGSDELLVPCTDDLNIIQGDCRREFMQCHSGDCIPLKKKCDGHVDCIDGRDESLELCFTGMCNYPNFQCANGRCIDQNNLCNSEYDCVDGSDELPGVCEGICSDITQHDVCPYLGKWNRTEAPRCIEPLGENIEFVNTTYHRIGNIKFVNANEVVRLKCVHHKYTGKKPLWNVCLNTGKWKNSLPKCEKVNMNAKTNGSEGCPLNFYNKDIMKISRCSFENNDNDCNQPIELPLNDTRVKIKCDNGYKLVGDGSVNLSSTILLCYEKKWKNAPEPRCSKFCKGSEVSHLYALDLECKICDDNENILPGVIANFTCHSGFNDVERGPLPQVECLEDGTWEGLDNLKKIQHELCSYNCKITDTSENNFAIGGVLAAPVEAPWITTIYWNTTRICIGTLIRLDLVLTVAHCFEYGINNVYHSINETQISVRYIKSNTGTQPIGSMDIQKYRVHYKYKPGQNEKDIAVLFLTKKISAPVQQGIVCLPWLKGFTLSNDKSERVDTIDSKTGKLQAISFDFLVANRTADMFYINTTSKICKGDSGSPVVVECGTKNWIGKCIIGLIKGTHISNSDCSHDVSVVNISYYEIRNFIDQYEQNFLEL